MSRGHIRNAPTQIKRGQTRFSLFPELRKKGQTHMSLLFPLRRKGQTYMSPFASRRKTGQTQLSLLKSRGKKGQTRLSRSAVREKTGQSRKSLFAELGKKGESRLSLFDLRGSIPNMPATHSLLLRSQRIPSRRFGNASASKSPTRRCLCPSGRSSPCAVRGSISSAATTSTCAELF